MIDRRGILAGLLGLVGLVALPKTTSASPSSLHQIGLRRLILRLQDDIGRIMEYVPGVNPKIIEALGILPDSDQIVNATNAYLMDLERRGVLAHPIVYSTEDEPFQMSVYFTLPEQARRCAGQYAFPSYGILFRREFPRGIALDLPESEPWFAPAGLARGKIDV